VQTVTDLAEQLGYCDRHVRRLLASGDLTVATRVHPRAHWRIRPRAAAKLVRHLRRRAGVSA